MGVTTWLDRITDESNLWLSALKSEEGNDLSGGAVLYLEDACNCLNAGSPVRASLSCFCAAECLWGAGFAEEAKRLYSEAGVMYTETAEKEVSSSIREALWALQRAYECFVLAEDIKETESTFEAFRLLARRANPFTESGTFKVTTTGGHARQLGSRAPGEGEDAVKVAIEKFLALRRKSKPQAKSGQRLKRARTPGDDEDGQAGIVSQLG